MLSQTCWLLFRFLTLPWGLPPWLSHKESACSAGDAGDSGLIPGWEDPLEEEMATHASILAWEIAWTEEPGEPQSIGSQESDTAEHTHPPPSGVIFSPQQSVTPSKHNSPCNTSEWHCGCPSQTVFLTVLGTLPCLHFSSLSLWPHLLHSSSATH